MDVKVTVKRKIRFQGKEYESVDELPDAGRRAYEHAMGSAATAVRPTFHAKIVFNGREYDGLAAMPQAVRDLYESSMRAVAAGHAGTFNAGPFTGQREDSTTLPETLTPAPIEPGSALSPRIVVMLIAGLIVLLGVLAFLLFQRPGG